LGVRLDRLAQAAHVGEEARLGLDARHGLEFTGFTSEAPEVHNLAP
jgi:hypothetical protein